MLAAPLGVDAGTNVSGDRLSPNAWNVAVPSPPPSASASTVSPCVAGATFALILRSVGSKVASSSRVRRSESCPGCSVTSSTIATSVTGAASSGAPALRPVNARYWPAAGGVTAGVTTTVRPPIGAVAGTSAIGSSSLSAWTTVPRRPNQLRCSTASSRTRVVFDEIPKSVRDAGSTVSTR